MSVKSRQINTSSSGYLHPVETLGMLKFRCVPYSGQKSHWIRMNIKELENKRKMRIANYGVPEVDTSTSMEDYS